jgi:uncharacterized protein (TIGR03083 family)
LITPDAIADHYAAAQARIADLVGPLDDDRAQTSVPGTPEWTVHDLLAHLVAVPTDIMSGALTSVPTPEQTQAQVEARRGRGIPALLEEWRGGLQPVVDGARAGLIPAPLAVDAITHEQDLRGALAAPAVPDPDAIRFAATGFTGGLGRRIKAAGLPALRLRDPDSAFEAVVGEGEPGGTVAAPVFEIFRALAGRRSRAQVAAFNWDVEDAAPYLELFCVFGALREQDLYDL